MSSLAPRTFLRAIGGSLPSSACVVGSSRSFASSSAAAQAVAVGDQVYVPFSASASASTAQWPERFLVNVSTPEATTAVNCTGGPLARLRASIPSPSVPASALPSTAGSELSWSYHSSHDRQTFMKLMREVRKANPANGQGRWFWAERHEGGKGLKLLLEEPVVLQGQQYNPVKGAEFAQVGY